MQIWNFFGPVQWMVEVKRNCFSFSGNSTPLCWIDKVGKLSAKHIVPLPIILVVSTKGVLYKVIKIEMQPPFLLAHSFNVPLYLPRHFHVLVTVWWRELRCKQRDYTVHLWYAAICWHLQDAREFNMQHHSFKELKQASVNSSTVKGAQIARLKKMKT